RAWRQVRDAQGREGWVAAEFVTSAAPASASALGSPAADLPTAFPTRPISIPPPPPTPTRAPTRTPSSSAPVAPSGPSAPAGPGAPATAKPQAPAVIVPTVVTRFSPPGPTASPGR